MSGICGIFDLRGNAVDSTVFGAMLGGMERRGPDGRHVTIDGSIALGHALLATTPESLSERLPLAHAPTGCTITADARLDNRDELIATLELRGTSKVTGDGELILRAFLKWGRSCVDHLLGDFAFAVWDPRDETLFCARDLIGMRQLIFHHEPEKLFAFASEPESIRRHPDIPRIINEARIADYLEDLEAHDLTSTFFRGLQRLPPAHALSVRNGALRIWQYGTLRPQPTLRLPSDEAYAEAFRSVFADAVSARLRSPDAVGSMLSGGMDSGSVTAMAARILSAAGQPPLQTYSAIGTDSHCQETQTIKAAQTMAHIEPHSISIEEMDEFGDEIATLIEEAAEPFDGHMTLVYAVYLRAQKAGRKVVLDAVGGDTTLGTQDMINWQLRKGNVAQAWKEAFGEKRFWGHPDSAWSKLWRGAGQAFVPRSLRKVRRNLLRKTSNLHRETASILVPDFAAEIELAKRKESNAAHVMIPSGDGPQDRARRILHPYVTVARERYDRVASALAIEPRDPFLDRRVMEFCLSLPADQLQKDGWPKMILRRTMREMLPDEVRWRTGKEHLGWDFTKALWQGRSGKSERKPPIELESYVRKRLLNNVNLQTSGDDEVAEMLMIQYLANWLSAQERVDVQKG